MGTGKAMILSWHLQASKTFTSYDRTTIGNQMAGHYVSKSKARPSSVVQSLL
jgi:hypothetical protein